MLGLYREISLALALATSAVSTLVGQGIQQTELIVIPDRVSCSRCTIVIASSINLSVPPDGFPGTPQQIAVDGQGNIYAAFGFEFQLLKYDPMGRLVRDVRPKGEGPGEFRSIYSMATLRGDSILLVDAVLQRAAVEDSAGHLARTFPMQTSQAPLVVVSDTLVIVNDMIGSANRAGLPLHEFTTTGLIGRSFGDTKPTIRPRYVEWDIGRVLAPAHGNRIWVGRTSQRFDLELWQVGASAPDVILRRDAAWFPARQFRAPSIPDGHPPAPEIRGIWEDQRGLVWVKLTVADRGWQSALTGRDREPASESGATYQDPNDYYDTLVEVIDPAARRVVARARFDRMLGVTTEPGLLMEATSDPGEEPTFRLVKLELHR